MSGARFEFPHRMSGAQVARVFRVTPQAVLQGWVAQGVPRGSDGTFDLPAVVAWRIEYLLKKAAPEDGPDAYPHVTPEQRRKYAADAQMKEIELAQTLGMLVAKETAEMALRRSLRLVVQALDGMPERLARDLEGKGAREIADTMRAAHVEAVAKARANFRRVLSGKDEDEPALEGIA